MAGEKDTELDDLAFQIYSQRSAATQGRRAGEADVRGAYQQAEMFLATRKKIRAGEIKTNEHSGPLMADCCAPNLPRTHPHNLVARIYTDRKAGGAQTPGDLGKVNRIKQWLDKNPTPETDPEQLVQNLNREFHELSWDLPTINIARAVFPHYCAQ